MRKSIKFVFVLLSTITMCSSISNNVFAEDGGGGGHAEAAHSTDSARGADDSGGSHSNDNTDKEQTEHTQEREQINHSQMGNNMLESPEEEKINSSSDNDQLSTANREIGESYPLFFNHPYSRIFFYHKNYKNIWFNGWIWNHRLTRRQHEILKYQGINHEELLNNKHLYKITINDNHKKKVIIVTKNQYDKIHVGDKIHLFDNKLFDNGKLLN